MNRLSIALGSHGLKILFILLLGPGLSSLAIARNVSPFPEKFTNIASFRGQNNVAYYFYLTGSSAGRVWGTGIYTNDSNLAVAAVHAGILNPGQKGIVKVTILPGQAQYKGSTANNITSSDYGSFTGSFSIAADDGGDNGAIPAPDNMTSFRDNPGDAYLFSITAKSDAGNIWGTNAYTDDSNLKTAVVHAGVLANGEHGVVKVVIVPGQTSYLGSVRNGISSNSFGNYAGSYAVSDAFAKTPLLPYPGSPQNPALNPGNLSSYGNFIGGSFYFNVTGANAGSIWGSNPYTGDSTLATAAVHAGILAVNQTGIVKVTMLPGQNNYVASSANGINSNGYGAYSLSYVVAAPDGKVGTVPVITSDDVLNYEAGRAFTYQISATNTPKSYNATGLPKGLSIDQNTGLISGIPQLNGRFLVDLRASNSSGTSSRTLILTNSGAIQSSSRIASASFAKPYNTLQLALPILINDKPVIQTLDSGNSEGWFKFYARAGKRYTIDIPASSIGKGINPAFQLYDNAGNVLTEVIKRPSIGQGVTITGTAPVTGVYRIRITNQAPFSKISELDNQYQIRIYLTDQPQQGIIKGYVLNACAQRGINEAEVSSILAGVVNDSTLTFSTGEFSLPLNPDHYHLKSIAARFQETTVGPINVKLDDTIQVQLNQNPTGGCTNESTPELDPALQQQQAVAVYDADTGLLVIRDIIAANVVVYAELQNIGNYRFQLTRFYPIPNTIHEQPAEYDFESFIANLPAVYAYGKTWKVQLKNDGTFVFDLAQVVPK